MFSLYTALYFYVLYMCLKCAYLFLNYTVNFMKAALCQICAIPLLKQIKDNKCWQVCGEKRTLVHCLWDINVYRRKTV